MNWEIVGAVAELIGALAVVCTLFYLSIQIRAQVRTSKAQILQDRSNQIQELTLTIANSEELARIQSAILKVNETGIPQLDPEAVRELSAIDRNRYRHFCLANYFRLDNLIRQHELGLMDTETVSNAYVSVEQSIPIWQAFGISGGALEKKLKQFKGGA